MRSTGIKSTDMKNTGNGQKLYSIGEVSRLCNISKKTLRFYDQTGIIAPDKVSEETGYRYYSEETLLLIPVLKYYKQMGFSLDQMKGLICGEAYCSLKTCFRDKMDELEEERNNLFLRYTALKDWYDMIQEAELVSKMEHFDVSIKYMPGSSYLSMLQDFHYNYMESIINIRWTNYLEEIENEITGPVILNFPLYREKKNGTCQKARIMQKPLRPLRPGADVKEMGGGMMASVYHFGTFETIDQEYERIEAWARLHGYRCGEESFERYVVDFWATRDTDHFLTEVLVPVEKA